VIILQDIKTLVREEWSMKRSGLLVKMEQNFKAGSFTKKMTAKTRKRVSFSMRMLETSG
jgi:hypothetical protein